MILCGWIAAICMALANTLTRNPLFAAATGVVLMTVGFLVLFNVRSAADCLAERRIGIWVFKTKRSAAQWQRFAAIVAVAGLTFVLNPGAVP